MFSVPSRRRSRAAVGVVTVGLLLASACAGDDDDSSDALSPGTTGAAGATLAPGATTVPGAPAATAAPTDGATATTAAAPVATTTPPPPPPTPPPPAAQLETASVALQKFVELPLLTAVVQHPDRSLWFTSQTGEVWKMVEGGQPELVLDLRGEVAPWAEGSERGMLGIGFNPVDGRLFLYFNDAASDSHVLSYALDANGVPDPASRWDVLFVDQPGIGHKGGGIVFDENGVMMLALGDGGGSRGRDAQDYSKMLGGIIRIIPRTNGPGYDIPGDNPFIGQEGIAPEIFAKGLRNPWGFCRDAATGDMWITDVGEDTVEEVNHIPIGTSGMNFGWYFLEGTQVRYDGAPQPNQPPVWEYLHNEFGPASIGGCVYRGAAIPALQGAYVFSDMSGPMFAIGEGYTPVRLPLPEQGRIVTAVKMGVDGEVIILTLHNGGYRLVPV
jgi:glucose/arabinose dehydrogenase